MSHRWPGPVRIFISRPRLLGGMAAGAATWVLLTLWPHGPELSTRNILSWFVAQLIFALHYAHEYYELAHDGAEPPHLQEGLAFPGGEPPDYWDFLHFAVVIGVASQTADIAFTRKALRRIGTVQGVVAFTFNTVVLALTINLLASLFG